MHIYYVPRSILNALHVLINLFIIAKLLLSSFTDKKTGIERLINLSTVIHMESRQANLNSRRRLLKLLLITVVRNVWLQNPREKQSVILWSMSHSRQTKVTKWTNWNKKVKKVMKCWVSQFYLDFKEPCWCNLTLS